ncbi:MAG TPA: isoleucine--tRNA ligase [Actinomycetota bacterium]|jgi:isoleucyl-tRNA synthetase
MARHRPANPKVNLPEMERGVLDFWNQAGIFQKSLEMRSGSQEWVFYEGPPTANAKPHVGNMETRVFKDVYPRYWTMNGRYVQRKAGWDCHGLPVELEIEKEIGTKTKRDIEAFGVAEFNRLCRESVRRYVEEWRAATERIGFWINLDDAYWTMDTGYMQSVWWALKTLHGRGLLYQADKVTAYCPRCGTPLSDHEVALGYAETDDPSIYVRLPLISGPLAGEADLLIWTTMPWTLVPNTLAAVGPEIAYVLASGGRAGDRPVVIAENRIAEALGPEAHVVRRVELSELVGARYRAPFDLIGPGSPSDPGGDPSSWRFVAVGDFVKTDEGTGIVHTGAAFGEDDLRLAREHGAPVINPVDSEGKFDQRSGPYAGMYIRDADAHIIEELKGLGLLVWSGKYRHTYPFCWRCGTPLIYYARPAWYIRTTELREDLLAANEAVNWYPEHIKHGRYGDWLANNVDWSLSRERYWGTPLPIWICENGHETAVGSLAELSDLAGRDLTGMDPHKPYIDEVTIRCPDCEERAERVPYLIDVWFDAGAMSYAQWGYSGADSEGADVFKNRFPADFIAEAIDQTRGWFYTLMAEGVLLFGETAYRNVVCLGHIIDEDGRKMSKSLGNVIDPWVVLDRYGADALRWFFLAGGSPWEPRRMSLKSIEDVVRLFLLTVWNTYAFYVTYANIDEPDLAGAPDAADRSALDRWVLSELHATTKSVRQSMESYDATRAGKRIAEFVDDLSNWYVRRSRRRFWDVARGSGAGSAVDDKLAAYATLHECLTTLSGLLAPFTPFVSEEMYRNLVSEQDGDAPESIHLTDFPTANDSLIDTNLSEAMRVIRTVVSLGRQVRTQFKVRTRQPLASATLHVPADPSRLKTLLGLVADELNVKDVRFAESIEELSGWRAKPNFAALGPRLGSAVQEVAAALRDDDGSAAAALAAGQKVTLSLSGGEVVLGPEDVELEQQTRAGWGLASDGSVAVALDLELTEALRREGTARELIHHVQNLRKSAGLEVADRIVLGLEPGRGVEAAVAAHRELITSEVLATEVVDGPAEPAETSTTVELDEDQVRISLRRA